MPAHNLHTSFALAGAVAALRIGKALLGFGGGGVLDVAFSAPDAPNDPSMWPTIFGTGGSGSGPPSPGEGDDDFGDDDYGDDSYDEDSYDETSDEGDGDGNGDDDSSDPPDGHDSWFDFLDWSTWTTAKNLQAPAVGLGIEVLELGAPIGDTLIKVKGNHQRLRDSIDTDHAGTSHLTGGSDD